MILSAIPKKNLCFLSIVLTVVTRNISFSSSYVVAESVNNSIHDDLLSDSLPERRPRIHGGWDSKEDRYSYAQVNLKWREEGHQCGGSLIAPDIVLTAGHCYGSFDKIEIGKYEKNDVTDISEEFESDFEIVHPDYDEDTTRYDIMLVKLKGTSTLATPVRVNKEEAIPSNGSMLTVIGVGYNADWDLPDVFQEASVQYQVNDQCDDLVDENGITLNGDLYPDMLCAGYDGRDSCYGDSGSPLVLKGGSEEEDIQIGVVSWGYECAGTLPGIYSRLGYLPIYNFIENYVCLFSDEPPDYMECDKWTMTPTVTPSKNPTGVPTQSPSATPSIVPTATPTQTIRPTMTPAPTPLESEEPTTVRLKEALAENVFLHESDLKLKTTANADDAIELTKPQMSSAYCAISFSDYTVAMITVLGVLGACMLF